MDGYRLLRKGETISLGDWCYFGRNDNWKWQPLCEGEFVIGMSYDPELHTPIVRKFGKFETACEQVRSVLGDFDELRMFREGE